MTVAFEECEGGKTVISDKDLTAHVATSKGAWAQNEMESWSSGVGLLACAEGWMLCRQR